MFAFVSLCVSIVLFMSGFEGADSKSHAELVERPRLEVQDDFNVPQSYLGYIASLSSGESYYDIGRSLSSLAFHFEEDTLQVIYAIENMGSIDSHGTFNFTDVELKSNILEGEYIDKTFGRMTIKGTLKGTTFTGKIHCQWKKQPASMNFIAIKTEKEE